MRPRPTFTILQNLLILLLVACQARAGGGNGAKATREFNGSTAFTYVEQQMAFGPRIPNTPGHDKMATGC
jgi:hypothetical protein